MNRRRALTLIELLVVLAILAVFVACAGIGYPLDAVFLLLFGWVFYLARVLPQVRPDRSAIAMAGLCLAGFGWGLHRFLAWIYAETDERAPAMPPRRWKRKWTASLVGLIVVMFVAGVSTVGITHQAGWLLSSKKRLVASGPREAARRAHSQNNLKQMGLGLTHYQQAHTVFPPGGTFDGLGRPLHGWQTALLPFIEQADLYNQINLAVPWNDPRNRLPFTKAVFTYQNVGFGSEALAGDAGYALTQYAGNSRVLGGRAVGEFKDGASETILAGEVPAGFRPWGDPLNWRDPALGINRSPSGFGGPFSGGANVLFADGSVRFLKNTTDVKILKALSTPDGGEPVSPASY